MTDLTHTRYISTKTEIAPVYPKFIARLKAALTAMTPWSDNTPISERRRRDIGLGEEYSSRDNRDRAESIATSHGIPL